MVKAARRLPNIERGGMTSLRKRLKTMKKFESLYNCIVTGQVSPDRIAKYFKDKKFYQYWKRWNSY